MNKTDNNIFTVEELCELLSYNEITLLSKFGSKITPSIDLPLTEVSLLGGGVPSVDPYSLTWDFSDGVETLQENIVVQGIFDIWRYDMHSIYSDTNGNYLKLNECLLLTPGNQNHEFINPHDDKKIYINSLLVREEELKRFTGEKQPKPVNETGKALTTKERNTLLRVIAGLTCELILTKKPSKKLGTIEKPNIKQLGEVVEKYAKLKYKAAGEKILEAMEKYKEEKE